MWGNHRAQTSVLWSLRLWVQNLPDICAFLAWLTFFIQGIYFFAACLWILWPFSMCFRRIPLYCSLWEIAHQELLLTLCLSAFFSPAGAHLRTLRYLFPLKSLTELCRDCLTAHRSWKDLKRSSKLREGKAARHDAEALIPFLRLVSCLQWVYWTSLSLSVEWV